MGSPREIRESITFEKMKALFIVRIETLKHNIRKK